MLFGRIRSLEVQPDRIKALAGRDEKRFVVPAAKADVGRPRLRHVNVFRLPSGLVKHSDAVGRRCKMFPFSSMVMPSEPLAQNRVLFAREPSG